MNTNEINKSHTLLFDGNHFLYKTLYVLPPPIKGLKQLDSIDSNLIFVKTLAINFMAEVKRFKNIVDRIVFTIDSTSWRKDFYSKLEYKGNREKDTNINWDNFYKSIKDFEELLSENGVIISKYDGAEGDDIVFAWSTYLNLKGEHCIIISGDRDLMQLVNFNISTNAYTIVFSKMHKKLAIYNSFESWLETLDNTLESKVTNIFNISQNTISGDLSKNIIKQTYDDLIFKYDLKFEIINNNKFLFKKVLTGDKSDNIESIYVYSKTNKTGKTLNYSITDNKAIKILEDFELRNGRFKTMYLFDRNYRTEIIKSVVSVLNIKDINHNILLNNLENNINILVLHTNTIPESIQSTIFNDIENKYLLKNDISKLSENLLMKDSKYNIEYTPVKYNVFDNTISKIDNELETTLNKIFLK